MAPRKSIPLKIQTSFLVRSKRQCCLCVGLNQDYGIKQGQIAHIDKDSSNDAVDNLVFLCLAHHDKYDSKTSQSKGFTQGEVKHYRAELDQYNKLYSHSKGGPDHPLTPSESRTFIHNDIPVQNPIFTGRDEELATLSRRFHAENIPIQVVHGRAGMSKTQVAIEYLHRHDSWYQLIWWVPAETEEKLTVSLANLADLQQLAGKTMEQKADAALAWLNQS